MRQVFSTNKSTVIFFGLLSIIVVPFGVMNLYNVITDSGTYSIGFRSFIAPVLPLLTYFTYRNGLISVLDDGVKVGRTLYPYKDHTFVFSQNNLALKDRPLTALWKKSADILTVSDRASAQVNVVSLEMKADAIRRLDEAISGKR